MPFDSSALRTCIAVIQKLRALVRADNADFVILGTVLTAGVNDGVDVQAGCLGLSGKFTQSLIKLFLYFVGYVVLLSEEYNSAGGY